MFQKNPRIFIVKGEKGLINCGDFPVLYFALYEVKMRLIIIRIS